MAATVSGVRLGFPKTRVVSGWLAQSTYATPSAQAAPDARKHPPNPISIRLRSIAPPQPGTHRAPCNIYRAWERRGQRAQRSGFPNMALDERPGAARKVLCKTIRAVERGGVGLLTFPSNPPQTPSNCSELMLWGDD